jgi:hypothetical protein
MMHDAPAKLSPRKAQKLLTSAWFHHKAGRLFEALPLYARVLEHYPNHPAALHQAALLGTSLYRVAKEKGNAPPLAEDALLRLMAAAVMGAPENAGAVHNFAKFMHDRGELENARQLYENAVALNPQLGESWTNLGNVYGELGLRMRQEACWHRALECPSGAADARFNLSFLKLLKGEYEEGWRMYEARLDCPEFIIAHGRDELGWRWDGSPVDGTLLLHGEQGAGDAIMMARYVPMAEARATRVQLEVIAALVPLFRAMFPHLSVFPRGHEWPKQKAQASLMSLPAIFGTTLSTVPDPAPIRLDCDGSRSIRPESGRIGLCWRGSTTHVKDRIRSMPFSAVWPLLDVEGVTWQSLQFGEMTSPPLEPLGVGDFLETARTIARCELVITVDTSIAHLAGSMGVPTWILLPFSPEFRWLQDTDVSPWYPSARLWRQTTAGDWAEVIDRVAAELRGLNARIA